MLQFGEKYLFSVKNGYPENQDLCGSLEWSVAPGSKDSAAVLYVCDGVSNCDGDSAALVAKAIRRPLGALAAEAPELYGLPEPERTQEICNAMKHAIAQTDAGLRPLRRYGATVSLALAVGDYLYTANLGDSPMLLVELDELDQPVACRKLYRCHNAAGAAVERGEITEEEALTDPRSNQLTVHVLGAGPNPADIHTQKIGLGQNSLLLLGSDGALSVVPGAKLLEMIEANLQDGLEAVNAALLQAVRKAGGEDNYTLLAQRICCR